MGSTARRDSTLPLGPSSCEGCTMGSRLVRYACYRALCALKMNTKDPLKYRNPFGSFSDHFYLDAKTKYIL